MAGGLEIERRGEEGHLLAVGQALLVTVLWSSSYVLIKYGLGEIPPLTFAGLRYSLAVAVLVPFALREGRRRRFRALDRRSVGWLVVLGLTLYAVTQGAQFVALELLPAASVGLMLSFTPILVALGAGATLGERPVLGQWTGIAIAVVGAVVYFFPPVMPAARALGLSVMVFGLGANAAGAILGRHLNRLPVTDPLTVTILSMGVGGLTLLGGGVATQGLPPLSPTNWLIVGWLAVVNTAFAFTLWNHTLQTLSAVESAVINNTMLVQVAVLGWVFLGEPLGSFEIVGLLAVTVGATVVQVRGR